MGYDKSKFDFNDKNFTGLAVVKFSNAPGAIEYLFNEITASNNEGEFYLRRTATGELEAAVRTPDLKWFKCSDDSIYAEYPTTTGPSGLFAWLEEGSDWIKVYGQESVLLAPNVDPTFCIAEANLGGVLNCGDLDFSQFDFGFDVATDIEAACWITFQTGTPVWNGTDLFIAGQADMRWGTETIKALGSSDFRMEVDITGFGGFNSSMPAGAGKDGSFSMAFNFNNGTSETFVVEYDIVGANWEGKTIKGGGGAGNGTTVHETISAGVPSLPFTFFIERIGTNVEIGREGSWSENYPVLSGSPIIAGAGTNCVVRDQSAGFNLNVTMDEMRFTGG